MPEYIIKFRRQEERDVRISADSFDVDEPVVAFYRDVTGGSKPVAIVLLDELISVQDVSREGD